jgi:hypothetical protein
MPSLGKALTNGSRVSDEQEHVRTGRDPPLGGQTFRRCDRAQRERERRVIPSGYALPTHVVESHDVLGTGIVLRSARHRARGRVSPYASGRLPASRTL